MARPLDDILMDQPTAAVVLAVDQQVRWWLSRGVTAAEASTAMGAPSRSRWEDVRRHMEQWMMRRGA